MASSFISSSLQNTFRHLQIGLFRHLLQPISLLFFVSSPAHISVRNLSRVTTSFEESCRGSLQLSPSRTFASWQRTDISLLWFRLSTLGWRLQDVFSCLLMALGDYLLFCSYFQTYACTASARLRIFNFRSKSPIVLPCVLLVCANLAHIETALQTNSGGQHAVVL